MGLLGSSWGKVSRFVELMTLGPELDVVQISGLTLPVCRWEVTLLLWASGSGL